MTDSLPEEFAREGAETTGVSAEREGRSSDGDVALQHAGVGTLHVLVGLLAEEPGACRVDGGVEVLRTRVADVSSTRKSQTYMT